MCVLHNSRISRPLDSRNLAYARLVIKAVLVSVWGWVRSKLSRIPKICSVLRRRTGMVHGPQRSTTPSLYFPSNSPSRYADTADGLPSRRSVRHANATFHPAWPGRQVLICRSPLSCRFHRRTNQRATGSPVARFFRVAEAPHEADRGLVTQHLKI